MKDIELYSRKRFARNLKITLEPIFEDYLRYLENDDSVPMKSYLIRKQAVQEIQDFIEEGGAA